MQTYTKETVLNTNPIPKAVLDSYNGTISRTHTIEAARKADRFVGSGHRYVCEWFLDHHQYLRAAYARIAEIEGLAINNGCLPELRAQRTAAPIYLTTSERAYIADWSAISSTTLKDIPEMEFTIEELILKGGNHQ
jgi:hypothetical protein